MEGLNWAMPASNALWSRFFMVMLINLFLSFDSAVLIAMAVNKLDPRQKKLGIILVSGPAVVLRVILTGFAVFLLTTPFLKMAGGIFILCIAAKLFAEGHEEKSLKAAICIILVADLLMNIDRAPAIVGAADGSMVLVIIGIVISIPIVVIFGTLLSSWMQKYPIIITFGAMILGVVVGSMVLVIIGLVTSIPIVIFGSARLSSWVRKYPIIITFGAMILGATGGEMIITDAWVSKTFYPNSLHLNSYIYCGAQIFFAACVVVAGYLWKKGGEEKVGLKRPEIR